MTTVMIQDRTNETSICSDRFDGCFDSIELTDAQVFERVRKLKMSWTQEECERRSRVGIARREELANLCSSDLSLMSV